MYTGVQEGAPNAPVDLRFIKRPHSQSHTSQAQARADVIQYLESLYESTAELLPDLRDTAWADLDRDAIPTIEHLNVHLDTYATELNRAAEDGVSLDQLLCKNSTTKRPRKKKRSICMNMDRVKGENAKEIKFLPPCSLKEQWEQYRLTTPLDPPASFPTFWRVSWLCRNGNAH